MYFAKGVTKCCFGILNGFWVVAYCWFVDMARFALTMHLSSTSHIMDSTESRISRY